MTTSSIKTRMNHPVDIHVGSVLRKKRKEADITQEDLAEAVGITFQQVQKYEKGRNRISCSKLYEFAKFLHLDISTFFDGFSDGEYSFDDEQDGYSLADGGMASLNKRQQQEKISALFAQINDQKVRLSVLSLLESLSPSSKKIRALNIKKGL